MSRELSWWDWLPHREVRRLRCAGAARALLGGDIAPARALLGAWRFAAHPELVRRLLAGPGAPAPDPRHRAALLAEPEALPAPADPGALRPEVLHRESLILRAPPMAPAGPAGELAWLLDELSFQGEELDREERGSWRDLRWPIHPARDRAAAGHWEAWLSGKPWDIRKSWEAAYLPSALGAFRSILELRKFPEARVRAILADVREGLFWVMVGGKAGPPGWRSLAARVLETLDDPPLGGPASVLDRRSRLLMELCAAKRGYGPETIRRLFPELHRSDDHPRALRGLLLEEALDLHVAVRLLETWEAGDCSPEKSRRVVVQNRGRARARLRALIASPEGPELGPAILSAPGLAARTAYSLRRLAKDWAWQSLGDGFTLSDTFLPDGLCADEPLSPEAPDPGARRARRAWVALVVLKGRLTHLVAWVRGEPGDGDARWGELLSRDLPAALIDPPVPGRKHRGYRRLRAGLQDGLEELLEELTPFIARVAEIPRDAAGPASFHAILDEIWAPEVRWPEVQYRRYRDNAEEALPQLFNLTGRL